MKKPYIAPLLVEEILDNHFSMQLDSGAGEKNPNPPGRPSLARPQNNYGQDEY